MNHWDAKEKGVMTVCFNHAVSIIYLLFAHPPEISIDVSKLVTMGALFF